MNQLKPGALAVVGGGVVLFIATFLDWVSGRGFSANAYEGSLFGITGVVLLIVAALCIAVPLLGALAPQVKLPAQIAGLPLNRVLGALGFAVLVLTLSLLFRSDSAKIGTILALLGSIAIAGGAHMENSAAT